MFGSVWSAQACHLRHASPGATTDCVRKQGKIPQKLSYLFFGSPGHRSYVLRSRDDAMSREIHRSPAHCSCLRHSRVLREATAASVSGNSNVFVASRYRLPFVVACQLRGMRVRKFLPTLIRPHTPPFARESTDSASSRALWRTASAESPGTI